MNRKQFLHTGMLAGLGSHFILKQGLLKMVTTQNVKITSLLGLNTAHLKSDSILLEEKTYKSFLKMKSAALDDGVALKIVSGYRSFNRQKAIWEQKFKLLTKDMSPAEAISSIITYSSIPGTSRHHWGTDIDIIDAAVKAPEGDLLLEKNYTGSGPFSNLKSWMDNNSKDYGFHLVYTNDSSRSGFKYEPWHYSYAPASRRYINLQSSDAYFSAWKKLNFIGKSEMSDEFISSYFKNYGLGINPTLMPS